MIYDLRTKTTYHAPARSRFHCSFENNTLSAANQLAMCLRGPLPRHQDPGASVALYPLDLAEFYEEQQVQANPGSRARFIFGPYLWRKINPVMLPGRRSGG